MYAGGACVQLLLKLTLIQIGKNKNTDIFYSKYLLTYNRQNTAQVTF